LNTDELSKLTSLYGKEVLSFCLYLTLSKYDAEELYQEVFLKAYEKSDKIYESDSIKNYLIGIAIRLWKNKKRKLAWRNRIAPTESIEDTEVVSNELSPINCLITAEEKNAVRTAVNGLNYKLKIPVLLYYSLEMSIENISQILKIPRGTVKSRLYNARKILKDKLEADING